MNGQRPLAAFAAAPDVDLAAERPVAARAFLDTRGGCTAGRHASATRATAQAVKRLAGRPFAAARPGRQALMPGVAAHALDYDDVLEPANAPTGGVLLGLDHERLGHALGLSISLSSGLKVRFGFGAKHLHDGQASAGGVLAAHLAAGGLTAAQNALTGPGGPPDQYDATGATLDGFVPAAGVPSRNLSLKSLPSCAATHRALATAAVLARGPRDEVDAVTVWLAEIFPRSLTVGHPDGPLLARFSLGLYVAVLLTSGSLTRTDFAEERLADPRIRSLADRVTVEPDPAQAASADAAFCGETATVEIGFVGETTERAVCAYPPGHPRTASPPAAAVATLHECRAYAGVPAGDLAPLVAPAVAGRSAAAIHEEVLRWMR